MRATYTIIFPKKVMEACGFWRWLKSDLRLHAELRVRQGVWSQRVLNGNQNGRAWSVAKRAWSRGGGPTGSPFTRSTVNQALALGVQEKGRKIGAFSISE